jgi:Tol biopolymer transport system component
VTIDERGLAAGARVCLEAGSRVDADVMLLDLQRSSHRRSRRTLLAVAVALVMVVATVFAVGRWGARVSPGPVDHPAPTIRAVHNNGVIAVGVPGGTAVDPVSGRVSVGVGICCGVAVTWSPDGRQQAFSTGHQLWLYQAGAAGPTRALTPLDGEDYFPLAWSPDGTTIARGSAKGIEMYSPTSGKLLRTLPIGPGTERPYSVSWSPDGSALVFTAFVPQQGSALFVIGADGAGWHEVTAAVAAGEAGPLSASWSPDGSRIAYLEEGLYTSDPTRMSVMLIHPDGTGRMRVADAGEPRDKATMPNVTWSPDGRKLAVVGYAIDGAPGFELFVMNPDGSQRTRLATDVADPQAAWQPVP